MLVVVQRFVILFGVWLVITGGDAGALLVGLATAAAAAAVSVRLMPPGPDRVRPWVLAALVPVFLFDSWRGGVDVARRAFHPRLPIQPGWLDYPLRLPPGAARVSLGNFLSLMPGTLAAGERHDALYVHSLDASTPVEPRIAREEARIARVLGRDLGAADA
jgi:multicomponent Na+:H+ antiporter subunit E